jgi:hypothetical protein
MQEAWSKRVTVPIKVRSEVQRLLKGSWSVSSRFLEMQEAWSKRVTVLIKVRWMRRKALASLSLVCYRI